MISFHLQAPSTAWEPVALRLGSSPVVWAWFKPSHAPSSVVFQIPPEVWQEVNSATPVTIRQLVAIAGIPALQGWTVAGQYYAWDERLAVFVDLPLAEPPAGVDPYLILWCQMTATLQTPIRIESPPPMLASDPPLNEDSGALFDSMDSLWRGIQQIETDVRRARSQLEQSMHRLNSLNRDLGPNEINAADSNDKKDWIDARRWLRDSAGILSKSIKQIDVGVLSGAGQRHRFEDIFQQYVASRRVFPGLKQAALDFEMYHKTAKHVLLSAQSALAKGSTDGERRANNVLQRIARKIRQRRPH